MKFVREGSFTKSVLKMFLLVMLACAPPLVSVAQPVSAQAPASVDPATAVRILQPKTGDKLNQDFVSVQFQPSSPLQTTSGIPTFQLQLDNQSPVTTSGTQMTFTGLQPGPHIITIEALDANGTPIFGSRNVVEFVVTPAAAPGPTPQSQSEKHGALASEINQAAPTAQVRDVSLASPAAGAAQQDAQQTSEDTSLPNTGSALPLLSIIGFGVLMGGIFSARRTR
jgi:LPXTG-motif cell wall-anchored protein